MSCAGQVRGKWISDIYHQEQYRKGFAPDFDGQVVSPHSLLVRQSDHI